MHQVLTVTSLSVPRVKDHKQVKSKETNEFSFNLQSSIREALSIGMSEQQIWLEVHAWEEGGLRKGKRLI